MAESAPLTVVVPVYNEGANIARWWEEAHRFLPAGTRVRIVYDFDEDDTLPVARRLIAEGAPLALVRNAGSGVLAALLTGLGSVESGPVLVTMADLSDDPRTVPEMLEAYRRGADVVAGSRFVRGGRYLGGVWLKRELARWGGRSLRWLAGFPVADATNNFRLYDAAWARGVRVTSTSGFVLGFELTLRAWMEGREVAEIPCTWRDRSRGSSRFKLFRWLPLYARLWARAMLHGAARRLDPLRRLPRGAASDSPRR